MRSKGFTTVPLRFFAALAAILVSAAAACAAARVAVLTPGATETAGRFSEVLRDSFGPDVRVLDGSLAETAFRSVAVDDPFNMSAAESRRAGAAIGSEFLLLIRADTLRRSSFERPAYYESYAAVYLVSSRTGRLVLWKLEKAEEDTAALAEAALFGRAGRLAAELGEAMKAALRTELAPPPEKVEELPDEPVEGFRPPAPYKRIKPAYTELAYFYSVAATVDIVVVLDDKGNVTGTEISRWAGYGLDESVTETVRKMNWRPAERNGRFLPMRFLLRYNFKKLEKE